MSFLADRPEFAPEEPPDPRPEPERENRIGYFFLPYDMASPEVVQALAAHVVVKDRTKDSARRGILYTAYHPSFEPRTAAEDPLWYKLVHEWETDILGVLASAHRFYFSQILYDCA